MEEEKHKFIIPAHERWQPRTVTVDPPLPTQEEPMPPPLEAPRIQHLDNSYPETAHLRDAHDESPPYPESARISAESELPVTIGATRQIPAAAVVPPPAPNTERQGTVGGWMRRLEGGRETEGRPRRTILGLTVFRFWAAVALGVIIVGVAIGVGLALGLANRSRTASSTSVEETQTVTQILGVPSPAPVNPYCTQSTSGKNTTVTPYDASGAAIRFNNDQVMSFDVLCNTFWPQRQGINPALRDILVMTVPDMLTCMTLCAQYNQGYSDAVGDDVYVGGGICVGVALVKGVGQFCYLKNATGINDTSTTGGFDVDSAVLTGDWATMTGIEQMLSFGGNVEVSANGTSTAV